jgi:RND family efflux transporter MFP subunit
LAAAITKSRSDHSDSTREPWARAGSLRMGSLCPALAVLILSGLAGCNAAASRAPDKKAVEVVVTVPIGSEVADYQDFTGRLDGLKTVDIRARSSGFILSAPFKEGDMVHEGDVLFLIDPTTYRADFNLAEANVRLAVADHNLMEKNAVRARTLIKSNAMAQEDYETAIAALEKSQATVAAMGATRDRAKEFLEYTRVIAPWSGRISRRLVDPGNLVNADNTILTTLVKDDQLYAYFDVDERTYLELGGKVTTGTSQATTNVEFPVLLRLANEEQFTRTGVVNFVDNRVLANTGTIRMRAVLDNPGGALRAGLFVRVRLPIGQAYTALLVPDEAVLSDQGRKYVYSINDKDEVVYRKVTLGQEIKGMRVIRDGLNKEDKVLISGMQRVRAGVQVHATMQDPPKVPESPLGALLKNQHAAKPIEKPAAAKAVPAAETKPKAPAVTPGAAAGASKP